MIGYYNRPKPRLCPRTGRRRSPETPCQRQTRLSESERQSRAQTYHRSIRNGIGSSGYED